MEVLQQVLNLDGRDGITPESLLTLRVNELDDVSIELGVQLYNQCRGFPSELKLLSLVGRLVACDMLAYCLDNGKEEEMDFQIQLIRSYARTGVLWLQSKQRLTEQGAFPCSVNL